MNPSPALNLWINSEGAQNFLTLATTFKCGQCRLRFDEPWVVPTGKPYPNNVLSNPKIAAHWQDTHGFPHDLFFDLVMAMLFDPDRAMNLVGQYRIPPTAK